MILTQVNFFSDVLALRCSMNIILPQRKLTEAKGSSRPKLRTLYLLHGYSDDHTAWQRWTSIERYVEGLNLAVIMPAAYNSFYTDMVYGGKYSTFLTEEVPAVARDIFPISTERADSFVAGLSMGGYGAFKLALTCPDRYAAAASLSGAVDISELTKEDDDPERLTWLAQMRNIFGDLNQLPGSDHDLFALAQKGSCLEVKPSLFQYCGTEDGLNADNIRFRDYVRTLPLDLTYAEGPGDHTWGYWDAMIQKVLAWLPLK